MKIINPIKNAFIVCLSFVFLSQNSYSQQIVTDGNTATQLQISGSVTDVTTSTIQGGTAFNSFRKFNVDQGNIVNLHVPDGAGNLLNLVHDQKTNINGTLNAFRNGMIGGNIYFANPHGIVVGASGVVNVGSLTAVTPTKEFMKGFFSAPGSPSATAVSQLLDGSAPINPLALVSIKGQINAINDVQVLGGDVTHEGTIRAGVETIKQFGQVVNLNGLQPGNQLVAENGVIKIVAADDVKIAGNIRVDGADGVAAGNIHVLAGGDITVNKNAVISAKGQGSNSDGGNIIVWADHDSELDDQALLDVRGGDVSGNGGFIEFSAKDTVDINGGQMLANAFNGSHGSILLDPTILNLNSDDFTNGADKTFQADERINVNGVTISSRQVNGSDHLNGDSIGNSGDLNFFAPQIIFNPGSEILAQANNGFNGGDIFVHALYEGEVFSEEPIVTKVHVLDSTMKGHEITLGAQVLVEKNNFTNNASNLDIATEVKIGSGSLIDSDWKVYIFNQIVAETNLVEAYAGKTIYINSDLLAKSYIESGATVYAGLIDIEASVSNFINASVNGSLIPADGNISAVFSKATSDGQAFIENGAIIGAQALQVISEVENIIDISVVHQKENANISSGTFAVSEVDSKATAWIGADVDIDFIEFVAASIIIGTIEASTVGNGALVNKGKLKSGQAPLSLTAAVAKNINVAKAGFDDEANIVVNELDFLLIAEDHTELSVNPEEVETNGLAIGIIHGDFQSQADAHLANKIGAIDDVELDIYSFAPESINGISVLSQKFLNAYFGYQGFFSKLLSFQKKNTKTSSQSFSLSKTHESSTFTTSSEMASYQILSWHK